MTKWIKKRKGNTAKIYLHPNLDRAIVDSYFTGISYNGKSFSSLEKAKKYAESTIND